MCRTWWCEINCITWALCKHLSDSRWRSLCSSKPPQMRENNPKQTQTPALSLTVTLMFRGRKKNCNLNKSRIIWHLKHRERPNTRENIKAWQRRFVWGPGPCCLVWTLFQSRDLWCLFQGYFFFKNKSIYRGSACWLDGSASDRDGRGCPLLFSQGQKQLQFG